MKKIYLIVSVLVASAICFSQTYPISNRTNSSFTVQDARFSALYNLFVPKYADTTAANLQVGNDSCSAVIYLYSTHSLWYRSCASGVKAWVEIGAGGGSGITIGSTTITSGTNTKVLFNNSGVVGEYTISGTGSVAMTASPTFTGTVTIPTPFTLGATSVTSTGTQLNYLNAATGTTGTASTNIVYSTSPLFTTPRLNSTSTTGYVWTATDASGNGSFQAIPNDNLLFDSLGAAGISPMTTWNNTLYARRISISGGSIDTTASGGLLITVTGGTTYTFSTGLTEAAGTVTNNLSTGIASANQTAIGSTLSGGTLTLSSTSHATKGNILLGTTSAYDEVNNRLGVGITIPTAKLHVQAGTLAAGGSAVRISATMPSNVGALNGEEFIINGSGSTSQTLIGRFTQLGSGYSGAGSNIAALFQNLSAGTGTGGAGTSVNVSYRPVGNVGIQARTEQTTTGNNTGSVNLAGGGNVSIGSWNAATATKNNATNVGLVAFGRNAGTTPIQVGGYFALADYGSSMPTFVSAALIADNGPQADPIFLARDNGTAVFTIADGGNVSTTGNVSLAAAGNKINITTGSNASIGVSGAMTAGTITISTTAVTASSNIFLTHATLGGTQGILSVGAITAGTSFVINSSNASDTGTVNWWIIN